MYLIAIDNWNCPNIIKYLVCLGLTELFPLLLNKFDSHFLVVILQVTRKANFTNQGRDLPHVKQLLAYVV